MLSPHGTQIMCEDKKCPNTIPNHKWGKIKAQTEGWFFSKRALEADKAYCPDHLPAWLQDWRTKNK